MAKINIEDFGDLWRLVYFIRAPFMQSVFEVMGKEKTSPASSAAMPMDDMAIRSSIYDLHKTFVPDQEGINSFYNNFTGYEPRNLNYIPNYTLLDENFEPNFKPSIFIGLISFLHKLRDWADKKLRLIAETTGITNDSQLS